MQWDVDCTGWGDVVVLIEDLCSHGRFCFNTRSTPSDCQGLRDQIGLDDNSEVVGAGELVSDKCESSVLEKDGSAVCIFLPKLCCCW